MTTDPRTPGAVESEAVEPETPGAERPPAAEAAAAGARPEFRAAPAAPDADLGPEQLTDIGVEPDTEPALTIEELSAKAEKADEYLGLAQRTKADFENYRKRAIREAALAQDRGIAKLAKELLPAVDNLDRALAAVQALAEDNHEQLVSGIKLVHADVISAFARAGIEPFSPEGEPFDPQWHEAVAQQPFEGKTPGTVVEVYQRGYKLGDSVLRPARVLVAA